MASSLPLRTTSTRSRPSASVDPSSPSSYHTRQASSTHQNDYDAAGIGHSKRSNGGGGDRHPPPPRHDLRDPRDPRDPRHDPSRPHRRGSTRSNHSHHQHHQPPDMAASPVANGAGPATGPAITTTTATGASHSASGAPGAPDNKHPSAAAKHSRSRTTIPTQSGKWILGKTIGAGSMGKVKLARKEDGSEQVCASANVHRDRQCLAGRHREKLTRA
jgi:serine/threonine protein kinase KIN1/2